MTTATAALTGNNPSPTSSGTPTPSGPGGPPTSDPGTASPSGWWDSVGDPGVKSWLATKNFPSANEAFTSYRNLENVFSADRAGRTFVRPKDDADAEGWANVAKALGVPDSPAAYQLPVPQGADDGFSKTAAEWFHKAGVPPRSANLIANEWNAWVQQQVEAGEASDRAESERQMTALKGEWGAQFDAKRDLAQRAYRNLAESLGLTSTASLERAESVLGAANLVKLFAGIGDLIGEHHFAQSDGTSRTGFLTGAADARRQIKEIQDKRMRGEIDDLAWNSEYGPKVMELGKIVAASLG